jgi:hypothetical protein
MQDAPDAPRGRVDDKNGAVIDGDRESAAVS